MNLTLHTLQVGYFEVNCYIIQHPQTLETIVVDPGADAAVICAFLHQIHAHVVGYFITHGHADHISGLAEVATTYPAPIYLDPNDAAWCFTAANVIPGFYPKPGSPSSPILELNSNEFQLLDTPWRILQTPGHSPGGICFWAPEQHWLFTGDTLFHGSAGRTDLPGANSEQMKQSLLLFKSLPDDLKILPGHGDSSTLKIEKETNYFLQ